MYGVKCACPVECEHYSIGTCLVECENYYMGSLFHWDSTNSINPTNPINSIPFALCSMLDKLEVIDVDK
jgi:hypothetical protein